MTRKRLSWDVSRVFIALSQIYRKYERVDPRLKRVQRAACASSLNKDVLSAALNSSMVL